MLRRVRAALVTGILWALVWLPVGLGVGLYQYWTGALIDDIPTPASITLGAMIRIAVGWALMGGINGSLFAFTLALAERGRTVATLSLGRVAFWGVVASVILPLVVFLVFVFTLGLPGMYIEFIPVLTLLVLGGACGASTLLLGRRAPESVTSGSPAA